MPPLKEFAAKRPKDTQCPLCKKLTPDVLAQIAEARADRVPRDVIVAWLAHDYRVKVSVEDVAQHMRERT